MGSLVQNFMDLLLEAAPWLVLGLILGGLMKTFLPTAFLYKHLSGSGFGAIAKAALLGAPLPLCSCGVIPAALGLRQAGASKPATIAFLVSTPETGVDSITVTYSLMGPVMAIVRPLSALMSAFVAGGLVAWFDPDKPHTAMPMASAKGISLPVLGSIPLPTTQTIDSCCSSSKSTVATASCCSSTPSVSSCCNSSTPTTSSCCSTGNPQPNQTLWQKAWDGIAYAFTQMLDDIVLWLVGGLLFAAMVKTFVPADFLTQWGQGFGAILMMILVGIPSYTCATASTPVATGLLLAGVSPGATLVFLLTGPATNVSTLGIVRKEMGDRSLLLYLTGIIVTATAAGWLLDLLVDSHYIDINAYLQTTHEMLPHWLEGLAVVLLAAVSLRKFLPRLSMTRAAT